MASQTHPQPVTATREAGRHWTTCLPILQWLPHYDRAALHPDLVAGVTVAAFAIPESMAYPGLAGLPPQYGLYSSMMAMIVYALFGTSRQLGIGVTCALSIMLAGTLAVLAGSDPTKYAALAGMTAILVAVIAIVAGLFRLGVIVNFISESALKGFSAGAALYIGSSQLPKLFGIDGVNGNFFERIGNVLRHLGETNVPSLTLGIVDIVLLLGERFLPRLPNALIVVLLAIALMSVTNRQDRGVVAPPERDTITAILSTQNDAGTA